MTGSAPHGPLASSPLANPALDGDDRGLPAAAAGLRVGEIGHQGWHLHEDLDTPVATIRADHPEHNAGLMRAWCAYHDVELWPHAKTTMSPQLTRIQLDAGATGLTAATAAQAQLLLAWGAPRVLVANQLVQERPTTRLAATAVAGGAELVSFVDSTAGVAVLERAGAAAGAELGALLEVGVAGARTGVRDDAAAEAVVAAVAAAPHVRLLGVAGYEGSVAADRGPAALEAVDHFLASQAALLSRLIGTGAIEVDRPVFSAGGSMFFDRVAAAAGRIRHEHRVVLRSGCYLLHDVGLFAHATPLPGTERTPGLRAALTVWGTVHSRPEPTRAYLDVGRRDVGEDQGLPRAVSRVPVGSRSAEPADGVEVVALNDQHTHLRLDPGSGLAVGDRVELGISHPCTTMDKWRTLALVDADGAVTGAVTTRF